MVGVKIVRLSYSRLHPRTLREGCVVLGRSSVGRMFLATHRGYGTPPSLPQKIPPDARTMMLVNLPARQFRHPELVGEVSSAFSDTMIDPNDLALEATEPAMVPSKIFFSASAACCETPFRNLRPRRDGGRWRYRTDYYQPPEALEGTSERGCQTAPRALGRAVERHPPPPSRRSKRTLHFPKARGELPHSTQVKGSSRRNASSKYHRA